MDPECLGAPGGRRVGLGIPSDLLDNLLQLDLNVFGPAHNVDEGRDGGAAKIKYLGVATPDVFFIDGDHLK